MFLVFVPAPYVDASSAWSLPNKWQRILVGAGGMIFELFVAAICAFIWAGTNPNTLTHQLAYNTMLIASVSTVIFNANPLLRYDGYYILSDWLEIPNLRQKSMEYSFGLIKRHLFRVKSPIPLPPVNQRPWLFLYAVTSGAYRIFVGVMIILVVANEVPVLGVLMAIGGVITWLVVPVVKTLNYLLLDAELHRKRPRAIAYTLAMAGAVVVLIGLIPFPMRYEAPGIIEPQQRQTLRARTPGFVSAVKVKDGQQVKAGDVLIEGQDIQIDTDIARLESNIRTIEMKLQQGLVSQTESRDLQMVQMEQARKELARRKLDREELTLRAPFDGVVVAPMIHELDGRFLQQGEEVATVIRSDKLIIRAVLPQDDAALAFMTEPVWWPLPAANGAQFTQAWDANPGEVYRYLEVLSGGKVQARMRGAAAATPDRSAAVMPAAYTPGSIEAVPEAFVIGDSKALFGKPANIEVLLTPDQKISTIIARFADGGTYDAARAEYTKQLGEPVEDKTSAKTSAATQVVKTESEPAVQTIWMVERDKAAVKVLLAKEKNGSVTLTYTLLGAKVDVKPASMRSRNLEARIVSRFPAAVDRVPHPSITHAGGGDHQNDPRDESGTKVTVPTFEVRLEMDNKDHKILPGQRAYVRFTMEKNRPLIWQWGRRFWQLIQTQSQQSKWM
jgi:multidrug efflux pump subunit AcrA (membrane-fusion protein)